MNVVKNIIGAIGLIVACIVGLIAVCCALYGFIYLLCLIPEAIMNIIGIICTIIFCVLCFTSAYVTVDSWRSNR